MRDFDPADTAGSLRRTVATVVERSPFSGVNFLFSDGERLYAYRLGIFELHWLARPGAAAGGVRAADRRAVAHGPAGRAARRSTRTTWRSRTPSACWATSSWPGGHPEVRGGRRAARRRARRVRRGARGADRGGGTRVTRRFALLVNPAAAGGRALRRAARGHGGARAARCALPGRRDARHRARASEARAAAEAGETVAALGRRRLPAPDRGRAGRRARRARDPARRARQRLRPRARHPARAARGPPASRSRACERMLDMAEVNGTPYIGIASLGFDSDANRIANEARLVRGNLVYLYAALRALAAWKPRRLHGRRGRRATRASRAGRSASCNSKAYGGGMFVAPHAELDDGKLDVLTKVADLEAPVPARPAQACSTASTSSCPASGPTGARRSASTPTAPSTSTPTATPSAGRRRPCACAARCCA